MVEEEFLREKLSRLNLPFNSVKGLLELCREDLTIDEALQKTLAYPDNEEYKENFTKAADFLRENAEKLKIRK